MTSERWPTIVRYPDGREQPFELERITRALYAATGTHGAADAFLAQELTESIVHFIAHNGDDDALTPQTIAEIVVKVVRELGHPALAQEYQRRVRDNASIIPPPPRPLDAWPEWTRSTPPSPSILVAAARQAQAEFSLAELFPCELVSAHREGLIDILDLAAPFELAGIVATTAPARLLEDMRHARRLAGQFIAIDAPEFDLATMAGDPNEIAARFWHEASFAAEALGVDVVLNLNSVRPPPRHVEPSGPLFPTASATQTERVRALATALVGQPAHPSISIWWHVDTGNNDDATMHLAVRVAATRTDVEFIFDRDEWPNRLGPGLERQSPATLLQVGVNLEHLLELLGGPPVAKDKYLTKLASLTRFAKTAAHVKQDFLRRHGHPGLREAFLLDRAALVLVPLGLSAVARLGDCPAVEFARDIVRTIRHAAENDRPRPIPVRVDCPIDRGADWNVSDHPAVAQRMRSAAILQSTANGGRFALQTSPHSADIRAAFMAALQVPIARVRFATPAPVDSNR